MEEETSLVATKRTNKKKEKTRTQKDKKWLTWVACSATTNTCCRRTEWDTQRRGRESNNWHRQRSMGLRARIQKKKNWATHKEREKKRRLRGKRALRPIDRLFIVCRLCDLVLLFPMIPIVIFLYINITTTREIHYRLVSLSLLVSLALLMYVILASSFSPATKVDLL